MCKKFIAFIKAHKIIALLLLFIFTCISPYIFYGVHHLLAHVSLFPCIKIDVYLNYMAIAFTGVPSAVIAVYALHIARKSEERARADKRAYLDIAREKLKAYISGTCEKFFKVSQSQGDFSEIKALLDAEEYIKQLSYHGWLKEYEADLCLKIHRYVLEVEDHASRTKSDSELANDFCNNFLEKGKNFLMNQDVINLMSTLVKSNKQGEGNGSNERNGGDTNA